jgi:very-short-patch-repair endonuclease
MQSWRASKLTQTRARQLRRDMTPTELVLWRQLRLGQLGAHFRRQHAVGPYVVDFFCAKARLVIELDGDSHGDPRQVQRDAYRTRWLQEQKAYRVLRFGNDEVLKNIEGVLIRIAEALEGPPP